jgi:hypothetical protein
MKEEAAEGGVERRERHGEQVGKREEKVVNVEVEG